MKQFFALNIDCKGRLVWGLMGLALLVGAAFSFGETAWLGILVAAADLFGLFAFCGFARINIRRRARR